MFGGFTNTSTAAQPSVDGIMDAAKKMKEITDRMKADRLKMQARMTDRVKCPECGRPVTFCNDGLGDTAYMCQHMIDILKKLPKSDDPSSFPNSQLLGLRVEVYPF
jgi:hypothetical protein